MDFTVAALSSCLKENAGHSILVKWPLKSSYAAVERDKMPPGKAENPLAQPPKVHRGRGNRGEEWMQKFTGKLGHINWSVRLFEMGSPLQCKIQWGKYFEWARVENIIFFTEGDETSDRTVCSPKHFSESQSQGFKSPWNWRRTVHVSQQPSKCCAHETLREGRKDLRGLSVKQGQFLELGQSWTWQSQLYFLEVLREKESQYCNIFGACIQPAAFCNDVFGLWSLNYCEVLPSAPKRIKRLFLWHKAAQGSVKDIRTSECLVQRSLFKIGQRLL